MEIRTNGVIFVTNDIFVKKKNPSAPGKSKTRVIKMDPSRKDAIASEAQAAYAYRGKDKVAAFLGISSRRVDIQHEESYFIDLIRNGIPRQSIDEIIEKTGISEEEIASILHISRRTIQRKNPDEPLNPEQSERLIELARLYTKGIEVFGDLAAVRQWMDEKILTLGHKKPKEFLDTSMGITMLLEEIGRIEHGVYS